MYRLILEFELISGEKCGNYRIDIIAAENVSDHADRAFFSAEKPDLGGGQKKSHRSGDLSHLTLQHREILYDHV